MLKTLAEEWQDVLDELMPPEASDIQKKEMRKAFYLGAGCMLGKLHDAAAEEHTEDDGVDIIQTYADEIEDFFEELVINFVAGHEV